MKPFEFYYRPSFLWYRFKRRKLELKLPESFDEMSSKQLIALGKGNPTGLMIALLPDSFYKRFVIMRRMNVAQRNDLLNEMSFLTKKPVMEKWLFKIGKFHPGDLFSNLSLFKYGVLEFLYNNYVNGNDAEVLDEILCILFNCEDAEELQMRPYEKDAVLLNYVGIHNYIAAECDALYSVNKTGAAEIYEPTNWLRISDEMAGDKIGTYEEVLEMNCFSVLQILNDRVLRVEEQNNAEISIEEIFNRDKD